MPQDMFKKRKKDILSKKDKSFRGKWDEKVLSLCNKINSQENYYTTSSCSGRVVIMIDEDKKGSGLFLKIYHDKINLKELEEVIKELSKKHSKKKIKFKQEPCALNVVCRSFEDAVDLIDSARNAGWKKVGLISFKKRFVIGLNSTERLEFPVIDKGNILVDSDFLKLIVKDSNKKLKMSWDKIKKLENVI